MEITICDKEFEVIGSIVKGECGDWLQPRINDKFEIEKVFYKGVDVTAHIPPEYLELLEREAYERAV